MPHRHLSVLSTIRRNAYEPLAAPRFARPLILALLLSPAASLAQDYPARSVKMIVPFGAGGPADLFGRAVAQHLSDALKQSFVIENRPGAGAIIGTDAVAKSPPDGYTLLIMSNTHTTNESLIPNRPYQPDARFRPGSDAELLRPADGRSPLGSRPRISRNSSRSRRTSRVSSITRPRVPARPITWRGSSLRP